MDKNLLLDFNTRFSAHMQYINQVNQMMADPFRMAGMDMSPYGMMVVGNPMLGLTDGRERLRDMARRPDRTNYDMMLADPVMDQFGTRALFGNMFQNVNSLMGSLPEQVVSCMCVRHGVNSVFELMVNFGIDYF